MAHEELFAILHKTCLLFSTSAKKQQQTNSKQSLSSSSLYRFSEFSTPDKMYTKVPHCCGNNFGGGGDTLGDESSDYDEVLEFQSEGDANESSANGDFSEFLWMENEELFEENVFQSLEEQELINECIEAMNELVLLDEIKQVEAEQITE